MVQAPSQAALLPAAQALDRAPSAPAVLRRAGKNALFAADEFFAARISNPHTRRAYARIVGRFLAWCEEQGIELRQVTPGLAGRFIEDIPGSDPTKNLALAALRHFFDAPGHPPCRGSEPVLLRAGAEARRRGRQDPSVRHPAGPGPAQPPSTSPTSSASATAPSWEPSPTPGARVGALARLRCGDLEDQGAQRVLRFREKGGQQREIPVRHDLDRWLEAYLQAARIAADPKETSLFRAALGKQKKLSRNPLSANSMRRMLKRRLKDARLPDIFSPHSFRVLVVTDLLTQDVPLEDVQYLAGHANPKTTQIYDRRQKRVTRNIVERISV